MRGGTGRSASALRVGWRRGGVGDREPADRRLGPALGAEPGLERVGKVGASRRGLSSRSSGSRTGRRPPPIWANGALRPERFGLEAGWVRAVGWSVLPVGRGRRRRAVVEAGLRGEPLAVEQGAGVGQTGLKIVAEGPLLGQLLGDPREFSVSSSASCLRYCSVSCSSRTTSVLSVPTIVGAARQRATLRAAGRPDRGGQERERRCGAGRCASGASRKAGEESRHRRPSLPCGPGRVRRIPRESWPHNRDGGRSSSQSSRPRSTGFALDFGLRRSACADGA